MQHLKELCKNLSRRESRKRCWTTPQMPEARLTIPPGAQRKWLNKWRGWGTMGENIKCRLEGPTSLTQTSRIAKLKRLGTKWPLCKLKFTIKVLITGTGKLQEARHFIQGTSETLKWTTLTTHNTKEGKSRVLWGSHRLRKTSSGTEQRHKWLLIW